MARPERFELPTLWFEARCSDPLSYGRVRDIIASSLFGGTYVCIIYGQRLKNFRELATELFLDASVLIAVGVGGVDVFGAEAQADHAGGDAAEDGEVL
jgi:hypothetical protein